MLRGTARDISSDSNAEIRGSFSTKHLDCPKVAIGPSEMSRQEDWEVQDWTTSWMHPVPLACPLVSCTTQTMRNEQTANSPATVANFMPGGASFGAISHPGFAWPPNTLLRNPFILTLLTGKGRVVHAPRRDGEARRESIRSICWTTLLLRWTTMRIDRFQLIQLRHGGASSPPVHLTCETPQSTSARFSGSPIVVWSGKR